MVWKESIIISVKTYDIDFRLSRSDSSESSGEEDEMTSEMALRKHPYHADGGYGIFWDEYRSIEKACPQHSLSDSDRKEDESEYQIQWLNDVGFTNIANKFRELKPIDHNDEDMKIIAASLTKSQATAVRRRIEYLNKSIHLRNGEAEKSTQNKRPPSFSKKRRDVRELFDESSKMEEPPLHNHAESINRENRLSSCSAQAECKKHYHGQRFTSVPGISTSPKQCDSEVSSGNFTRKKSSDLLRPSVSLPSVALQSKDQGNFFVRNTPARTSFEMKSNEYRDKIARRSPGVMKHVFSSAEVSRRGNKIPPFSSDGPKQGSAGHLIFMTGEEREKALKSNALSPHSSKETYDASRNKVETRLRRWSTNDKMQLGTYDNRKSKSEINIVDSASRALDKLEIDGGPESTKVVDFDEIKNAAINHNYINVDSISDSNINIDSNNSGKINKFHKNKVNDLSVDLDTTASNSCNDINNRSGNNYIDVDTVLRGDIPCDSKNLLDNNKVDFDRFTVNDNHCNTKNNSLNYIDVDYGMVGVVGDISGKEDIVKKSNEYGEYRTKNNQKIISKTVSDGPGKYRKDIIPPLIISTSPRYNILSSADSNDSYTTLDDDLACTKQDNIMINRLPLDTVSISKTVHNSNIPCTLGIEDNDSYIVPMQSIDNSYDTRTKDSLPSMIHYPSDATPLKEYNIPFRVSGSHDNIQSIGHVDDMSTTEHKPLHGTDSVFSRHTPPTFEVSPNQAIQSSSLPKQLEKSNDGENKQGGSSVNLKKNDNLLAVDRHQSKEFSQSGSDDNKSVSSYGSLGSMDDLNSSNISNERLNPDATKSRESIAPSAAGKNRRGSGIEGDARLDVGPSTPREFPDQPLPFFQAAKFPPLPNFNIAKVDTGMTHIGDLSSDDMLRVRSIALIELTALFDAYMIPMNRRKTLIKPKYKDSGIFGVPLTTLSQREATKKNKEAKVPRVFKEMLIFLERHGLQEEGVLRVPGGAARIKLLREAIDKNDLNSIKWEERNVKDVVACLKQFLRDLPVPLLSYEYQNTFTSVADLPEKKIQLQALNLLVILLHPVHQKTLKMLLVFLNKVIKNEAINKMGLNNVSMIMAPNLLLNSANKLDVDEAQKAEVMTNIMRMLIKYQPILWTIPSFMVGQIRYLYDAGAKTKDPKAVLKIIAKQKKNPTYNPGHRSKSSKSSGSSDEEYYEFEDSIIRVKAPSLKKHSMAIKINDDTVAADIVSKFQWRRQNSQKEKDEIDTSQLIDVSSKKEEKVMKFFLYEVGGNIVERRLEGTANISAILKVNPHAQWVLKGSEKQ